MLTALKGFLMIAVALATGGAVLVAQSRSGVDAPPQTPWGHPDLQGTYSMPLPHVDRTQQMFEYACHEGNHAMRNILSAARAAEQDSARK